MIDERRRRRERAARQEQSAGSRKALLRERARAGETANHLRLALNAKGELVDVVGGCECPADHEGACPDDLVNDLVKDEGSIWPRW